MRREAAKAAGQVSYCPKCGVELRPKAIFCHKCGTLVNKDEKAKDAEDAGRANEAEKKMGREAAKPAQQVSYCPRCGVELRPKAMFCHKCGALVSKGEKAN